MAFGSVNAPRKKVDTSHFVTAEAFETFQATYQSTYESAKAAGYSGTEEEFYAALSEIVNNGSTVDVNTQTVTLTTQWIEQADGTYAQTVPMASVTGVAEQPIWVDCSLSREDIEADIAVLEAWSCINTVEPAGGSLTFFCYGETPSVAIPVNVVVM